MRWRASRVFLVLCAVLLAPTLASCTTAVEEVSAHSLTGYWQNFDNGATNLRLGDVPAAYDIVAVAFADADPARKGAITFALDPTLASRLNGYTDADFKSDIDKLHAQGRKVVLSVGGQNGPIVVDDAAAASAFAETAFGLMQEYGFDGVDIDLENAPNLQFMTSALRQLAASAGSDFVLTMAPETLYVQPGGSYLQLIDEVNDLITVVNTQHYNSGSMLGRDGRAYSQGTVDFITAQADILLDGHLRPDQVGLGLPASPQGAGSGYVNPSVVNDALSCLAYGTRCGSYRPVDQYPSIRGAMTWTINWDAANGYEFAETVGSFLDEMSGGGPTPTTDGGTTTTAAPPTTTGPTCDGLQPWDPSVAYWGGDVVSAGGHRWSAKWWTQGDVPGDNAQDVWVDEGPCDGGGSTPTTTAPPPTTTPPPTTVTPPPTTTAPPPPTPAGDFASGPYYMPLGNNPQDIGEAMAASGERNFVFAFVLAGGGCTPTWDGVAPVASDTTVLAKVQQVRAAGGDISVSFGGYNGVELGAVCPDAASLADAYQQVIDKYELTHIDLDIEGDDLGDAAAEAKRFEAVKILQQNAAADGRELFVTLTLPVTTVGLSDLGMAEIRRVIDADVQIDLFNIMAFDYGGPGDRMAESVISVMEESHADLKSLFPSWDDATVYQRTGIILMNGHTDQPSELFTQQTFREILAYAQEKHLGRFQFWSLNRDRPCTTSGPWADGTCSSVEQTPYEFTIIGNQYTG